MWDLMVVSLGLKREREPFLLTKKTLSRQGNGPEELNRLWCGKERPLKAAAKCISL